jgi:hypothetical protein
MAALITALDNYTPKQFGENGHIEYGWSISIQESILQFSFQLTRTDESGFIRLKNTLKGLLKTIKSVIDNNSSEETVLAKGYLSILYKMIGHTRDIIDGKGEYSLAYMMIYTWYDFYPELAKFALKCLVDLGDKNVHQYGSWKDIKYFCDYCRSEYCESSKRCYEIDNHPLVQYAVKLVNDQIRNDHLNLLTNPNDISLAAKWVPREKSRFEWLYQSLATEYFKQYLATANTDDRKVKSILKCKTEYRKLLSTLNRKIDTLQIKQCGNSWAAIDFNKVTSISLSKQKKAFLNVKKDGDIRYPDNIDRVNCAEHFNQHIKKSIKGEIEMKGKRVGMADFTKQAIDLIHSGSQIEKDLLNSQWRDNSSQNGALGKMIAMVDVSGSMDGDPMNVAIALGIRIAEKSVIGKRVMTFSSNPTWVNLEPYDDFVSQVRVVKAANWGTNTNFHAALDLILDAIIQNKMSPADVQDMVLVILSDMQIDAGDTCNKQTLYDTMLAKYEAAGIRVHGTPYKPPHILFWNLRSTSGFPSLSIQPNTSMMAGFSPALLNLFCDQGLDALQSCTPWSLLERSLANDRYKIMGDKLYQEINL